MSKTSTNNAEIENIDLAAIMRNATNRSSCVNAVKQVEDREPPKPEVQTTAEPPPKREKATRKKCRLTEDDASLPSLNKDGNHYTWQRFSFICDKTIIEKIHNIASKEGFSISAVMEKFLSNGIDSYERKHGAIKPTKKSIDDLI